MIPQRGSRAHRRRSGSGPLRLLLLIVAAAALLLVPAAAANAAINSHVTIDGTGSGSVIPIPGEEELAGNPEIECHYESPGPQTGTCDTEAVGEGLKGIKVTWEAAPNSKFVEWTVEKGNDAFGCGGTKTTECAVFLKEGEIKLKATFEAVGPPSLTVAPTGEGSVSAIEPPVPLSGEIAGCEEGVSTASRGSFL
jgi:hypothetical protein